ncbi:MAG: formylglycine-generating enzyme family protein [Comamonadaceae bacterium]|nr:formylglycine-generating enzyme family protein [Comamonadaceae bacterium]
MHKLSQHTGKSYRLPSEAEWEYACRAGGSQTYCGSDGVNAVGWYGSDGGGKTHPVAGKQANAFGLYDMSGNVGEWVQDVWHSNYDGAPTDGTAWTRGGDQARRVLRGGNSAKSSKVIVTYRSRYEPDYRISSIGFRIARTL